jgi:hypothetical protein
MEIVRVYMRPMRLSRVAPFSKISSTQLFRSRLTRSLYREGGCRRQRIDPVNPDSPTSFHDIAPPDSPLFLLSLRISMTGDTENNCCYSLAINLAVPIARDGINSHQQLRHLIIRQLLPGCA